MRIILCYLDYSFILNKDIFFLVLLRLRPYNEDRLQLHLFT